LDSGYVGSISQTLTYPFDVLRRKMQVTGMKSGVLEKKYNGALDALTSIFRNEGLRGLYRGLWPNLCMLSSVRLSRRVADKLFSLVGSEGCAVDRDVIFHV
jgi:hypothetical protein